MNQSHITDTVTLVLESLTHNIGGGGWGLRFQIGNSTGTKHSKSIFQFCPNFFRMLAFKISSILWLECDMTFLDVWIKKIILFLKGYERYSVYK